MLSIELSLIPGMSIGLADHCVKVTGGRIDNVLPDLSSGAIKAVARVAAGPVAEDALSNDVLQAEGLQGVISLERAKFQMQTLGVLRRTIRWCGAPLATLHPVASGPPFSEGVVRADLSYVLSRFALLRRVDAALQLECPLGRARIICHDSRVVSLFAALSAPRRVADAAALAGLPESATSAILDIALHAGAAIAQGAGSNPEDDLSHPIGGWEFHDLLFHSRTRIGLYDAPYGGTFHMKGAVPPPPVAAPRPWAHEIELAVPDLATLQQSETPFAAVVERRRSIRAYDETPIAVGALGEFLYRTARVQQVLKLPPGEMDLSLRPYPGGGAVHELEIYPVVGNCQGLERGIYHYDPINHRLGKVRGHDPRVAELLQIAWRTADRRSQPQVLFTITARFRRLQWKYQSVAYAVILKNVGVVYEAMYLTATAMGLAPCSLGGGTADLFCDTIEIDPYEEAPVGEFLLGSPERTK